MGGSRCSYRSCSVRTDKQTHLFHYPVFDKLRCHQWITNAQKLNFLDLKLSQLKNRMICEHHFTDDSFMNDMKAKLKHDAVPTKDGPFCNPSTHNVPDYDDREIPIIIDDIENDYLTGLEKRAHLSVKFGDFLTNDIPEQITTILLEDNGMIFNRNQNKNYSVHEKKLTSNSLLDTNAIDTKAADITVDENNVNLTSLYNKELLLDPKVMNIKFEELNFNTFKQDNKADETLSVSVLPGHKAVSSPSSIPQSKKVKIISEKRISEPVRLPKCELQPVSPSVVLKVPDKKNKGNVELNGIEINTYFVDVANQQQMDNIQGVDNSGIMSSQSTAADQMYLVNEYNQPLILSDTIEGVNNSEIKNVDLLTQGSKQIDNNITLEDRIQLKQETEMLNDIVPIPLPNIDFVSTTRPPVFTLTDQPQVSTHLTDSASLQNYVSTASTEGQSTSLLSKDSEILGNISVNTDHTFGVPNNAQNVDKMLKNKQSNLLNKKQPSIPSNVKANKSFLKSKLPPEKIAAIEEKRKFNMKLRDIINSCLNKLDEEPETSKLTGVMQKELSDKTVVEHLSSDSSLPTRHEYNISYLEARLQRMEDTLLNKIEQNSQRITDLKKTVAKPVSGKFTGKKSAYTQTYLNTETTKRHLYQQISQFLSPEANSLIYEELFLNKCISKLESLPKKRKVK